MSGTDELIDHDEPPMFDLDSMAEADSDDDAIVERGGPLTLEGVVIPADIAAFGNGRLPDSALQQIGIGHHRLYQTAADAFGRFRELAKAAGIDLTCTDSYRTLDQQVELKQRKPDWSATPGRSVHGWGFAVDVSVGTPPKAFGVSVFNWLKQNGPPNGWFQGRPKDEPWHWVYRGVGQEPASSAAGPGVTAPVAGSGQLSLGSTGADVQNLRVLLGLKPGDTFDAETDTAVRAFQQTHQLLVDGKVGPKTLAALKAAAAPAPAPAGAGAASAGPAPVDRPELSLNATGDAVKWVQRRLGLVDDGKFGPQTDAAVKAFQQSAGLSADGKVGPKTWTALTA